MKEGQQGSFSLAQINLGIVEQSNHLVSVAPTSKTLANASEELTTRLTST